MPVDIEAVARELHTARTQRRTVSTITSRFSGFGLDDAYAVQAAGIRLRLEAGESRVGGKLGFTSRAMQRAMGVDQPNYGILTDAMVVPDGRVRLAELIHPKVEPEIAFGLDADLPAHATAFDVLAATAWVAPCLEVVDSRFDGFRFAAYDNIADNSSAAKFVLGDPQPPSKLDLQVLGLALYDDGELRFTAAGAAALGHPAAAVAWMARHHRLGAGDVVISGGLTAPVDLRPGQVVSAEFDHLGVVTVTTE